MIMETIGKKKFGIFIRALHNEVKGTQHQLVNELFFTLGVEGEVDNDGVLKNWMAGKNQGYVGYFKDVEIKQEHYDRFIKLLDEMIKTRYKNIQNTLRAYSNEYTYIDFETDNRDEFFKSILNQFKDIVGLPPDQAAVSIARNRITSENSEAPPALQTGGAHIAIPEEYKRCMYCVKWDGNYTHAQKIKTGIYGTCMMYNKEMISICGDKCQYFDPDYGKISFQQSTESLCNVYKLLPLGKLPER